MKQVSNLALKIDFKNVFFKIRKKMCDYFIVKCQDQFIILIDLNRRTLGKNHGLFIRVDQVPWHFELFTENIHLRPLRMNQIRLTAPSGMQSSFGNLIAGRRGNLMLGATRPPHTDYTGRLLKMPFVLSKDPDMRILEYADHYF